MYGGFCFPANPCCRGGSPRGKDNRVAQAVHHLVALALTSCGGHPPSPSAMASLQALCGSLQGVESNDLRAQSSCLQHSYGPLPRMSAQKGCRTRDTLGHPQIPPQSCKVKAAFRAVKSSLKWRLRLSGDLLREHRGGGGLRKVFGTVISQSDWTEI